LGLSTDTKTDVDSAGLIFNKLDNGTIDTWINVHNYGNIHVGIFKDEKDAWKALSSIGQWFI
jgi:hypothetical protein